MNYWVFKMNGQDYHFCYERSKLTNILFPKDCPSYFDSYRIDPNNFMFSKGENKVYRPPSVYQYEYLRSINHTSISVDDYDYYHVLEK